MSSVAKSTLACRRKSGVTVTPELMRIRGWCNFNASHVRIGCVNTSLTKIKLFPKNKMTRGLANAPLKEQYRVACKYFNIED